MTRPAFITSWIGHRAAWTNKQNGQPCRVQTRIKFATLWLLSCFRWLFDLPPAGLRLREPVWIHIAAAAIQWLNADWAWFLPVAGVKTQHWRHTGCYFIQTPSWCAFLSQHMKALQLSSLCWHLDWPWNSDSRMENTIECHDPLCSAELSAQIHFCIQHFQHMLPCYLDTSQKWLKKST